MDLTNFLEGDTAKEWDNTPSPSILLPVDPHSHLAMMATSTIPSTLEELAQRVLSSPKLLLNLNPSPGSKGCLTQWTTLTDGSRQRWAG